MATRMVDSTVSIAFDYYRLVQILKTNWIFLTNSSGEYNNDRPRRDYNDDKQQIFVGGLPADITEAALREVFR